MRDTGVGDSRASCWIQLLSGGPIVWLLLSWSGLSGSGAWAEEDGHKRADKVIKRVERVMKEMTDARHGIEKALEAYGAMLQNDVDNRRSTYKDLITAVERSHKRQKEMEKRVKEMAKEALNFFKAWKKSLKNIQSKELVRRSRERLDDSRGRYDEMLAAWRQAADQFKVVTGNLSDQLLYLGHELNADAAGSLREDKAKLDGMANTLFDQVDDFASIASEYIGSLKS